jgi:hypothetical protein
MNEPTIQILIFGAVLVALGLGLDRLVDYKLRRNSRD